MISQVKRFAFAALSVGCLASAFAFKFDQAFAMTDGAAAYVSAGYVGEMEYSSNNAVTVVVGTKTAKTSRDDKAENAATTFEKNIGHGATVSLGMATDNGLRKEISAIWSTMSGNTESSKNILKFEIEPKGTADAKVATLTFNEQVLKGVSVGLARDVISHGSALAPFFAGAVGVGRVYWNDSSVYDNVFTYEAKGGATLALSQNSLVYAAGRFFGTTEVKYEKFDSKTPIAGVDFGGSANTFSVSHNYRTIGLSAGIIIGDTSAE